MNYFSTEDYFVQSTGCNKRHFWENQCGRCFENPYYHPHCQPTCKPQNPCDDFEIRIPKCAIYFLAGYIFSKTLR